MTSAQPNSATRPEGQAPSKVLACSRRILLIGDQRAGSWASDLAEAFKKVGAQVEALALRPSGLEETWQFYRHSYLKLSADEPVAKRVRDKVSGFAPQIILFLDPYGMDAAFLKAIERDLNRPPLRLAWFSDCRRTSWKGVSLFDTVFYADSAMQMLLEKYQQEDLPRLKYLPLAANTDRFKPSGIQTRENKIVFAGTLSQGRLKTLQRLRLRGLPIQWHGPQVDSWWKRLRASPLNSVALNQLYQSPALALNLPRKPRTMNGVNFRVFEVAACQNLILTKWVPDLELVFDPYEELTVYRDWDEVPLVFRSLMYDPYRAEEMALKAREHVLAKHTFHHRVQTILETLGQKAC